MKKLTAYFAFKKGVVSFSPWFPKNADQSTPAVPVFVYLHQHGMYFVSFSTNIVLEKDPQKVQSNPPIQLGDAFVSAL